MAIERYYFNSYRRSMSDVSAVLTLLDAGRCGDLWWENCLGWQDVWLALRMVQKSR